jgi:acyl-CoA dehydrogenase
MDFAPSAPRRRDAQPRCRRSSTSGCCPPSRCTPSSAGAAAEGRPHDLPPVVEELKARRAQRGLWNLFLPEVCGLSLLDYAPLAELSGWSPDLAPEAMNCARRDTGNMEVLHLVGHDAQKAQWLDRCWTVRSGRLRDDRAGRRVVGRAQHRDPRSVRDGDEYVVTGRKWWTTGAADPRCRMLS